MIVAATLAALVAAAPGSPTPLDYSQHKAASRAAARERAAFVAGLPRGASFRSAGQRYQMAGNVRAFRAPPRQPADQALAAAGLAPSELVESKGRYLVVREAGALSPTLQVTPAGRITHPVAVNAGTGALGVVTGVVAVKLRSARSAVALADQYGLELTGTATGIRTAFYRVPQDRDLVAASSELARDRRVVSAQIEVVEAFDEPL